MGTGAAVAMVYVASSIVSVLWCLSSDRSQERVRHVSLAALVGAVGLTVAAFTQGTIVCVLALAMGMAGTLAAISVFLALPSSFLGRTAAAGGIALINSLANLGGFAGPYLMGWLKAATGGYAAGLGVLAGGLTMTAVRSCSSAAPSASRLAPAPSTNSRRRCESFIASKAGTSLRCRYGDVIRLCAATSRPIGGQSVIGTPFAAGRTHARLPRTNASRPARRLSSVRRSRSVIDSRRRFCRSPPAPGCGWRFRRDRNIRIQRVAYPSCPARDVPDRRARQNPVGRSLCRHHPWACTGGADISC